MRRDRRCERRHRGTSGPHSGGQNIDGQAGQQAKSGRSRRPSGDAPSGPGDGHPHLRGRRPRDRGRHPPGGGSLTKAARKAGPRESGKANDTADGAPGRTTSREDRQRLIRARLYDADGRDHEITLKAGSAADIGDRKLLWIDVQSRDRAVLDEVAAAVGINDHLASQLAKETGQAQLVEHPDHIHLVLQAMDLPDNEQDSANLIAREIDLVAGRNWVATVHSEDVPALDRVDALSVGESRFGALDATGFLATIVDEVLAGYLRVAQAIEMEIDRLDERALRTNPSDDVLVRVVALRRRIGTVRRSLTPHRMALSALARPEMELFEELGRPWPALNDRLDRAIEAVENLRELLLGTFEIHMGRAAQQANEIMKRLTLLSAVLLPAVVLAGVMGMNFQMSFFQDTTNFWVVVGVMGAFGATLLAVARWRRWL
jgi:Mg2+ and Co2+ transporter CorA